MALAVFKVKTPKPNSSEIPTTFPSSAYKCSYQNVHVTKCSVLVKSVYVG